MPNPTSPSIFGLQKAQHIGPDPQGQANTDMNNWVDAHGGPMQAALPNPENRGALALDSLSKLARTYSGPIQETLGEFNPFHTPVGGEGMYNVGKVAPNMAPSIEDSMYQKMMEKFGMGRK